MDPAPRAGEVIETGNPWCGPGATGRHAVAPDKEAAQPFGERPKSREETPKKGMRPKAQNPHAMDVHTGV